MLMRDQAASLREKLELHHLTKPAKTIAVVSGKGGVGKSNLALNFALELTNNGRKVLLFDLDVGMGNIEILLGKSSNKSIVQLFSRSCPIEEVIEEGPNALSYVAGGSGLAEIFTMDESKYHFFLAQFPKLLDTYDFIIFDMGAGISEGSAHFVLAADECIVVTTPEPTSLTDAYAMIKHVLQKSPDMSISLLVNRAASIKAGEQTIKRLSHVVSQFLQKNIKTLGIVPEDKKVRQAVSDQIPFILSNRKGAAAVAVKDIVEQYLGDKQEEVFPETISFISRLASLIRSR